MSDTTNNYEIIKRYESLEKQLEEKTEHIAFLESNRIGNENRLNEMITLAKNAKDIGEYLEYPVQQIRELDAVLLELIEEITKEVEELDDIKEQHEKVSQELSDKKIVYKNVGSDFCPIYRWIQEKEPNVKKESKKSDGNE
jgi:DNA repair exonuclease SbcCD ATPase subunit